MSALSTFTLLQYATSTITLYAFLLIIYRLLLHPLRGYPGPLIAKLTQGHAAFYAARRRLHLEALQYHARYGPVVRVGPDRLVFNTATALRDIYQNDRITKSPGYLATARNNTFSIFNSLDKDVHRQKRQVVGQAVSERSMRAFEPTMAEQIETCLKQIGESANATRPVDMTPKSRHLGLDVVGQLAFGYDLRMQIEEENRFVMNAMTIGSYRGSICQYLPWLSNAYTDKITDLVFSSARDKYYRLLQRMISDRVTQDKHAKHDFYSFVADYFQDTARGGELWFEALFFMVAGGDTTATAICAAFFYLSRNQNAYDELASEIRSTFSSGREIKGGSQLSSCHYLRACIDESLRMSPPVSTTLWRQQDPKDVSTKPLVVDGHVIPRGTMIAVNVYAIHHNESYFSDPFTFKPHRWIAPKSETDESRVARKAMHDAFTPFSTGSRGCAGKAMAYLEISLILAKALWYFDFQAAPGKLGEIGGGKTGATDGRGRPDEYQIYDIFIARHEGPHLAFTPRGDLWKELGVAE